jgi:hypothetical protein
VSEPARLTRERYAACLDEAKARGFAFVRFAELAPGSPPPSGRFIALRHDVDFAPEHALAMAELEHDAGVASTYFVLVDGEFYDATRPDVVRVVRRIRELGHEVGLHFAVSSAVHDDLAEEVAFRARLLGEIAGAPVRSFSQHDPVNAGFADVELPGCVDAYEAVRRHDLLYVSDSAMLWREHSFESALAEDRDLCLLAHPHSWLHPEHDYVALIRALQARELERMSARFDRFVGALASYYERRLREGA